MAIFCILKYLLMSRLVILLDATSSKCSINLGISICYGAQTLNMENRCGNHSRTCGKNMTITNVRVDPYSTDIVKDMVIGCCGTCANFSVFNTLQDVYHIPKPEDNPTDFLFPVLGRASAKKLYGYYFLPIIEPPSLYYFTLKNEQVLGNLIVHCLNMWPLFLSFFFFIAISGFLEWFMERKSNPEEFPPSFFSGWMNGCWWSFVSMTTVGYGDKVPKSGLARLCSVVWILVGITIFSIITAMLTSEMTVANMAEQPDMAGHHIGTLKHRTYDTIMIATHGGIATETSDIGTIGILSLVMMLKKAKVIKGFVLDRFTMLTFYKQYADHPEHKFIVSFLQTETMQSEMPYKGEKLSYGILMKHEEDYNYFADFILDNQHVINACNALILNRRSNYEKAQGVHKYKNVLYSPKGVFFWPLVVIGLVLIGCIICFGFIYEWNRKKENLDRETIL